MILLRVLRWGDDPGLPGRAQYNYKSPYNKEAIELEPERR